MKKFYAFAAAAMMAATAFAQNGAPLYATGADFPNGAWSPATPSVFTFADGVYTLEIENLSEFKISTATGEGAGDDAWNVFNAGALTCDYGKESGVVVALTSGDANIKAPITGAKYTITVAGDLSTIKLDTDAAKPTTATELYIKGDMNSWSNEDAWKLTPEVDVPENTIYTFTCAEGQGIGIGEAFKIATASWASPNLGGGEDPMVMLDSDIELKDGSQANLTLEEEWDGVLYLNLDFEGQIFVWMSNDKTATPDWYTAVKAIEMDANVEAVYYNLQGIRVANPENGIFIQVKGNKVAKVVR